MAIRKYRKKLLCFIISLFLVSLSFSAQAEEVFPRAPLRWSRTDMRGYYLTTVNADLLGSSSVYKDDVSTAVRNWNTSSTKASCKLGDWDTSNLDLVTANQNFWNSENLGDGIIAITMPVDTNGRTIRTESDAIASTRKIKSAAIYFKPVTPSLIVNNSTYQLQTVMHEIGHVYCMGHVFSGTTIMTPSPCSQTTLSTYDVWVMSQFYGSIV